MLFTDRLTLGKPRETSDGYLAVRARAARSGVYEYLGCEIDPESTTFSADQVVRVYRPEEEVFSADSVSSFLMKPVTNDHPTKPVTADNWREYAKGVVGKALRDGEFLAFDIVLMDAGTIKAVKDGKRELSNGYSSEISFESGTAPNGQLYDAVQRSIRGNHVAVVDKGRAGSQCRIGDAASCGAIPGGELEKIITDERTYNAENGDGTKATARSDASNPSGGSRATQDGEVRMPHTLIIDGLQVPNVSDEAKAAIEKLQGQIKDERARADKAEGDVTTLTATVSTKDGEIAVLTKKIDDSKITPAQLEQMVADRTALIGNAKAIDPKVVTDGKTEVEIRRAVVESQLGDSAKDLDDAAVLGAFKALSKDVKPVETKDALRSALEQQPVVVGDAKTEYAAARDKYRSNLSNGWQSPAPAAAA